ncbi:MAG: DNA-processing protein DprA [Clostridia bacterium]|nr:DNA-processing protein DprA [Clostridia bacterium]MBQ2432995.1 DNA-processing protein DprA [Clostridia bacterium]
MQHNDNAFTAMLLTLPLTADKEELVRPLASAEFIQLVKRVEEAGLGSIGNLNGMDISAVMAKLDMPEQEAYRICMLLSRTMPLSYAMERFYEQNIEILTGMDEEYPARLVERLGADAPTAMYVSGNIDLLKQPMVALLGISGVKMTPAAEKGVRLLVRSLKEEGFGLITSSEPGACRVAEKEAFECGVNVVSVLAGDLAHKKEEDMYIEAQLRGQALLVSLVHPDAPYTGVHAISRNRIVYSMALASFIATTDAKRGESDAIRKKLCDWLYAFDTPTPLGNRIVISRGVTPVPDFEKMDFAKYAQNWRMANAQQLSFL